MEPAIFGALLEGGLGHDKQWALGAHYTHEADILKVVGPTITDPWRERIESLSSRREALAAQSALMRYVVLVSRRGEEVCVEMLLALAGAVGILRRSLTAADESGRSARTALYCR